MLAYWYAPFNNAYELEVAAAVSELGVEVVLQSLRSRRGDDLGPADPLGVRVVRDLPDTAGDDGRERTRRHRGRIALERVARRHRVVRGLRSDIVHVHTYNPFLDPLSLRLLKQHSRSLVLSVHNVRPHEQRFGSARVERALLSLGYRAADRLIVAHPHLAQELERLGVAASRIDVVPLAVPVEGAAGPPPGDGPLLFFGTLRANKGIGVLLEAMRSNAHPRLRLHVAGQGLPELEDEVRRAAAGDARITAELGYVTPERRIELLTEARGIVLPYTHFAAQSGVLRDAQAFGRPVVASSIGALGDEVRATGCGLVVPPGDPAALAQAMTTLVAAAEPGMTLGAAAANVAAARSPATVAARVLEIYRSVLA